MIPFVKLQSIGNDFVLLDSAHTEGLDRAALARAMCDRFTGIGADGLLVLDHRAHGRLRLEMRNPDGTDDFCGNGLRCALHEAAAQGWTGATGTIDHGGRTVPYHLGSNGTIETVLGPAEVDPAIVPLARQEPLIQGPIEAMGHHWIASAVSTGSTHLVILTPDLPTDEELRHWGPALEHHPWFPLRTSVMWTQPVGDDAVRLRIWERGLGETLGCGSGSVAAAAVWMRTRGRPGWVDVVNPGGQVRVSADDLVGDFRVTGIAHRVFSGVWTLPSSASRSSPVG